MIIDDYSFLKCERYPTLLDIPKCKDEKKNVKFFLKLLLSEVVPYGKVFLLLKRKVKIQNSILDKDIQLLKYIAYFSGTLST